MDGWTDGRMDGWKGDQKCPSIFLKFRYYVNKQDVLIPNMVSKVVYGFVIRTYEHFNFQNWGVLDQLPIRKTAQEIFELFFAGDIALKFSNFET